MAQTRRFFTNNSRARGSMVGITAEGKTEKRQGIRSNVRRQVGSAARSVRVNTRVA